MCILVKGCGAQLEIFSRYIAIGCRAGLWFNFVIVCIIPPATGRKQLGLEKEVDGDSNRSGSLLCRPVEIGG
jgi:hypothetical protein